MVSTSATVVAQIQVLNRPRRSVSVLSYPTMVVEPTRPASALSKASPHATTALLMVCHDTPNSTDDLAGRSRRRDPQTTQPHRPVGTAPASLVPDQPGLAVKRVTVHQLDDLAILHPNQPATASTHRPIYQPNMDPQRLTHDVFDTDDLNTRAEADKQLAHATRFERHRLPRLIKDLHLAATVTVEHQHAQRGGRYHPVECLPRSMAYDQLSAKPVDFLG